MNAQLQTQAKKHGKSSFMLALSGLLQRRCACGTHTMAGRECEACKKKEPLQRASFSPRGKGTGGEGEIPPIVHQVLRSPGQPLDQATRAFFEPSFGHDFSQVRVHADATASESARAVDALAYTAGEHVVFEATRYAPGMTEGRRLLAHELSHVLQQRAAGDGSAAGCGLKVDSPYTLAEQQAEAMAERFAGTVTPGARDKGISVHAATGLQRAVIPQIATIRKKLAAKDPSEKDVHDMLLILKRLETQDLQDTLRAMGEELVERFLTHFGKADLDQEFDSIRRVKNNWPRTVTTTVGKTTVTTTVIGSCSPQQFHQIYLATLLAVQWLNRAIARADAYLKKPGDATTQDVRAALELHFHNTTDRVAHHVRERLAHIRADILGAVPFSIECHGVWDRECDVAMAYASTEQVTFCNSFFYNTRITQAEAVVHEMAHAQVGGTHIADRGYQSDRVLGFLSTAEALTNAESYGLFVQQLGTGKVPPMPAPKDKPADCPKDWWDWIQFSIARAQRWNFNARLVTNSLRAEHVRHWDARRQQLLGGTSESAVDAAKKAFKTLDDKLHSPVSVQCEPLGGGRCDEPGMLNYWYAFWSDFHVCPLWRYQSTPEDHIEGLLLGLYGYLAGMDDNARRQGYARLAREWSAGPAPSLTEVLGSTLWRSDRLRITVTPIEPKTPGQDSFTENGTTPHPRMSDRLPVYQTESGQAVELPFRCRFEFFMDEANLPRPMPFSPPRVSAKLHFHDASGKYQHIFPTGDTRPIYQGAGRPLYISGPDILEMTLNRNGRLNVKAQLEDPDTHFTRVYDDIIQIRPDRSTERPPAPPQTPKVEGCTGWEKNPEGFVKYVATYVAIHEINPVIDTRVRLTGCYDSHQCTVAFPDGLNMTILWNPATHKVLAKWDEQGVTQRRVYDYSCAAGRVKLVSYTPPSTPVPASPSKEPVK